MDTSILITGVGAPGVMGTIDAISKAEIPYRLIGVDIDLHSVGRSHVDEFALVPAPEDASYIDELISIVKRFDVKVIVPQVTRELAILAHKQDEFQKLGCNVLVNDHKSISVLNDKYLLLERFREIGLPTPRYYLVRNLSELQSKSVELGYPQKPVVAKLPVSNGMRGLRILKDNINHYDQFMFSKPNSASETLERFMEYFDGHDFPPLLLMEYLDGPEYTVDCLADRGHPIAILPRIRSRIRSGISFESRAEKHEEIIDICQTLIEQMKLSWMFGFQFILDRNNAPKIIESNPRVQGTMALGTYCNANVILGAVRLALGIDSGISQDEIQWGKILTRYWGAIVSAGEDMQDEKNIRI